MTGICARRAFFLGIILCFTIAAHGRCDGPVSGNDSIIEEFDIPDDGDGLYVPVTLANERHTFVIDTGSTYVLYDQSLRPILGDVRESQTARTPNGTLALDFFDAPAAHLGRLRLDQQVRSARSLVACADLRRYSRAAGFDVRGVVGLTFLCRHVVRLDFDRRKLSFVKSADDGAGTRLSIENLTGLPAVRATLPGVGETMLGIDTGSVGASGSLHADLVRALSAKGLITPLGASSVAGAGGASERRMFRLASLKIAGFEHSDLVFREHTGNIPSHLGLGYLLRYIITIDFRTSRIYLRPSQNFARSGGVNLLGCHQCGLGLVRKDGRILVESVAAGGPASQVGIRPSDTILAVNGNETLSSRLFTVRQMITDAGAAVHLAIDRDGIRRDFVLTLTSPAPGEELQHTAREPPSRLGGNPKAVLSEVNE